MLDALAAMERRERSEEYRAMRETLRKLQSTLDEIAARLDTMDGGERPLTAQQALLLLESLGTLKDGEARALPPSAEGRLPALAAELGSVLKELVAKDSDI